MPRISLSPRMPQIASVRPARGTRRRLSRRLSGRGNVVGHVEYPFHFTRDALKTAGNACVTQRRGRFAGGAKRLRRIPRRPVRRRHRGGIANLMPSPHRRHWQVTQTQRPAFKVPEFAHGSRTWDTGGPGANGRAPIASIDLPHRRWAMSALPSTAGRPARKIPAFSRPICSSESPSQSTWSRPIVHTTPTSASRILVASRRPPSPTSSTATSTLGTREKIERCERVVFEVRQRGPPRAASTRLNARDQAGASGRPRHRRCRCVFVVAHQVR